MPNVARSVEVGDGADFTVVINRADAVASDSFPAPADTPAAPTRQLNALLEERLTSPNWIGAPPPSRDVGPDASGSNPGSKLSETDPNSEQVQPALANRNPSGAPGTFRLGAGRSQVQIPSPDSNVLEIALFTEPA
jgi:hypothetical protein